MSSTRSASSPQSAGDARGGVAGRTVLLAGATSPSGLAIARVLLSSGARVIGVGRDPQKLAALAAALGSVSGTSATSEAPSAPGTPSMPGTPGAPGTSGIPGTPGALGASGARGSLRTEVCALTNEAEVAALAERLAAEGERIDGVIPLVGGWRGGGGLAGQTEEDYRALEEAFTALRIVSRAFDRDLRASSAGRFAIVSSSAVARPLAGGANYAAIKAASEAWTRAVAHGFAKAARDAGEPLRAAAVVFRVRSLDPVVDELARRIAGLWDAEADALNDTVIDVG